MKRIKHKERFVILSRIIDTKVKTRNTPTESWHYSRPEVSALIDYDSKYIVDAIISVQPVQASTLLDLMRSYNNFNIPIRDAIFYTDLKVDRFYHEFLKKNFITIQSHLDIRDDIDAFKQTFRNIIMAYDRTLSVFTELSDPTLLPDLLTIQQNFYSFLKSNQTDAAKIWKRRER